MSSLSIIPTDAGPAAVLSVPCTDFPAADGGALHRAGKSEAIFNHSPGDEELTQTRSMQSTETSAHRRQLITASLLLQYTDLDEGTCTCICIAGVPIYIIVLYPH